MTEEKEFPETLTCLIGEGLIDEVGNKKTLNGIFAGDEIILKEKGGVGLRKDGSITALPSLIFMLKFIGVKEEYICNCQLHDPSNTPMLPSEDREIKPNNMNNFVTFLKIIPFPIKETGLFTLSVTLDGQKEYTYKFNVREAP